MLVEIEYGDIKKYLKNKTYIFVDVRSPGEYEKDTIPGAINIPIFDNEERAEIGTLYKQDSVEMAKKIGVELVSQKLPQLYDQISNLEREYERIILFCSRGGYRSSSLISFLQSLGIKIVKLKDGYKGYRRYVNENLPLIVDRINFIVLYGNTGTGKTHILEALDKLGADILDLEGCANHRGSTLGSVGLGEQKSQKMFESLIFSSLSNRKTNTVFVEGESRRIGKDVIPLYIFEAMQEGTHIKITADMYKRVDNILKDYVHNTDNELVEALNYLRKFLGNHKVDSYIELIDQGDYRPVIQDLFTNYYDPMYEHKKRNYLASFHSNDSSETAKKILKWAQEQTSLE